MQAKDGDKIERSADTTMLLARTTTMVEILTSENKTLREKNKTLQEELIRTRKRVAALQKVGKNTILKYNLMHFLSLLLNIVLIV